jgi:cell shape-determining protein MreD
MDIRLISSRRKRRFAITRWSIFTVIIWLVFIFMTTGSGIKPNILLPLALCISMSEDSLVSAVVGILCGLLSDIAAGNLTGSTALVLLIGCVCVSLLFTHFLRQNLLNYSVLTLLYSAVHFFLDYFFSYFIWGYDSEHILLIRYIIPEFVLTILSLFAVYPVIKTVRKRLTLRKRYVLEENQALIKD